MIGPLAWVLSLAIAAFNILFWWKVVTVGERWFRASVERRFDVVIKTGFRGAWVCSGPGSRLRLFAIEWLQLVYFMAAFFVWSLGMLAGVGLLSLVTAK